MKRMFSCSSSQVTVSPGRERGVRASCDPSPDPNPDASPTSSCCPNSDPNPDASPTSSCCPNSDPNPDASPTSSCCPNSDPSPDPSLLPAAIPRPTPVPAPMLPQSRPQSSSEATLNPSRNSNPSPDPGCNPHPRLQSQTPGSDAGPDATGSPSLIPSPHPSPSPNPDPNPAPSPDPLAPAAGPTAHFCSQPRFPSPDHGLGPCSRCRCHSRPVPRWSPARLGGTRQTSRAGTGRDTLRPLRPFPAPRGSRNPHGVGKLRQETRGGHDTGRSRPGVGVPCRIWGPVLHLRSHATPPQMESWTRQDQKLLEAVTRGDVARVATLAARKAARPAKLNARGQSALHLAAAGGLTECLTLLLEHGAPVNDRNDDGSTALHLATIACQPQCVKVLLQHGANEHHVDGQNRTPLHWAASSGCASSVLLLCDHDAPLDVPDTHGQTPLMLAARGNHAAACAQLLRRGAEPGLADRDGRTALELALAQGSLEAAELLQSHQKDKDTGNVTGNVTGKAPSWALRKVPHYVGRAENGAGQVGIQGEEEEEAEEQRDGRAARRLREELVRKTLECRRLEEAAGGIRRRLRELVRLLPGRDAGEEEDEEDEEDDGACLELLARRVAELRKRTRDEEWEGGHGNAEAPALIPFLAWLGEECSKMREAKAGAFCRSQELHREAEDSLRDEAVGRSAAAWEELAAGLEQALDHQDQIHARILQESQILLGKLRREPAAACRCAVNGAEPAAGGKSREEMPRESGRMEKELLELREGNGKLLVELARLGRERERLQQELRELRDPGKRDEAWRLRRELRALRDGVGARVREAGDDAGAAILRDLHRRLDALVRSQHEALQLITEMEGEAGESPRSGGESGIPGAAAVGADEPQGPERGVAAVPAEPPGPERWREAAGRERELRELREKAEGLERSLGALRERAARLERACRDKDGKLKQLLAETEKLSAEVLGLRGRSARLQLQLEVQQKQHRDTVAVYRSHLLQAAQGFMDKGVHAALLRILRAEAEAGPWH